MFDKPIPIDDHYSETYLQGIDICPVDNSIILLFEDYQEEGEYVIEHTAEDLILILKTLREQYAKKSIPSFPGITSITS